MSGITYDPVVKNFTVDGVNFHALAVDEDFQKYHKEGWNGSSETD